MAELATIAPEPRERGLLMTGPNVLKIRADPPLKRQTRRIVKPQPPTQWLGYMMMHSKPGVALLNGPDYPDDKDDELPCPYGAPGDRLWVRETWAQNENQLSETRMDTSLVYRADGETRALDNGLPKPWRPAIHMPRWASRLTLEITEVRVERLQDISEADAIAEGVTLGMTDAPPAYPPRRAEHQYKVRETPVQAFARSWNRLHGKGAWERNDWVWAISFTRLP